MISAVLSDDPQTTVVLGMVGVDEKRVSDAPMCVSYSTVLTHIFLGGVRTTYLSSTGMRGPGTSTSPYVIVVVNSRHKQDDRREWQTADRLPP
jgi:hypothetical protein